MRKTDIIWFIEHTSRELDVAAAVSALLEKKYNKTIKILPFNSSHAPNITREYNPKLVLIPYCYSLDDKVLYGLLTSWPKAIYLNLSWEQIFYNANLEYKAPRDEFARKCVIHHSWSRERSKFLQEKGVPAKHIFINGHPAYKLYDKPYRQTFIDRDKLGMEYHLDHKKKWIFFPENYSWFFYSDYNIEEIIKNGQNRETAYLMRNYCGTAFKKVIEWLEEASDKHGNEIEIILRPRPAFGLSYFKKVLNNLNPRISRKVHILEDYSVREWILASDIIISSFSTSLIESAIANKPCFMLEPVKIPKELEASWYAFVERITSESEFINLCTKKVEKNISLNLSRWAKNHFFVNSDPIAGLANFIGQFDGVKFQSTKLVLRHNNLEILINNIINICGNLKRSLSKESDYYSIEDNDKFKNEVNKRTRAYKKIL